MRKMTTQKTNAPLAGLVVLDLTHMLSGPYGTMTLSDLGARTIKVEPPGKGEGTRQLLASTPAYSRDGMGAYFLTLNRGKESVALDLKSQEGLQVFYDLVRHADIVFDNFSVGVTQRLCIDHETLSKINPRIITCTVTGFGETGPDNRRPAFDQVVQAMGAACRSRAMAQACPLVRAFRSATWVVASLAPWACSQRSYPANAQVKASTWTSPCSTYKSRC